MPPLILQPDALGWVTMPPDGTNQGFSGPLLRLHSVAISPGGTPPTALPYLSPRRRCFSPSRLIKSRMACFTSSSFLRRWRIISQSPSFRHHSDTSPDAGLEETL